jgi:feruloyl esterase
MALPQTTITLASVVEAARSRRRASAGANPSGPAGQVFRGLPAFCRVAATIKPSSDSDIKIEVWLPVSGWNGKFQGVGNGGWAARSRMAAMAAALQRGYATASTDTGHAGNGGDGSFALNHPRRSSISPIEPFMR